MQAISILNNRYGKLVVVKFSYKKNRKSYFLCKCDCGNFAIIRSDALTFSGTKSCGCLALKTRFKDGIIPKNKTHGMSNTPFFFRFLEINQRCNNKNSHAYKNYGGRGIQNEWKKFIDFKNDMYSSYLECKKIYGQKKYNY
jgi:hypothetical protein